MLEHLASVHGQEQLNAAVLMISYGELVFWTLI